MALAWVVMAALWLLVGIGPATAQPAPAASAPSRDAVDEAARTLRDIPGLQGTRTVRELRLKDTDRPPEKRDTSTPEWLTWLAAFAEWFGTVGRWFVWLLIALAVGLLLLQLRRWFIGREPDAVNAPLTLPTQVRGLDIAPQSLPADVGGTAWALWQRGERRQALSLLYRGALSRLVHSHGVPIRASSTEGDCLRLASPLLRAESSRYLGALVSMWAHAVYAARWPADAEVQPLCEHFRLLDKGTA